MSYAGSCLDERKWHAALENSVLMHKALIEIDTLAGTPSSQIDAKLEERTGKWLIQMASQDPAYAHWASHHYQKLGALQTSDAPLFQNFPARLQQKLNP